MDFCLPDWKSFLFVTGSLVLMYFEKKSGGLSLEYEDISLNVVFKIKNAIGLFFSFAPISSFEYRISLLSSP